MKLMIVFFLMLISTVGFADSTLGRVVIQSNEIPAGWGTPYSNYSVSNMATVFFDNYESIYENQLSEKLAEKQFQSFSGPNGRGTIFYLNFPSGADINRIENFAKNLIWEGASPSPSHPERIFHVGKTLVIVSFADNAMAAQVEKIIQLKR